MRKIGLFFGSFDPPHIGHISIVRSVLNLKMLDEIFVVPAYKNLFKKNQTPYSYRMYMCKSAFSQLESVTVSNREGLLSTYPEYKKGVPTYVVIDEFKKILDSEVYMITTRETYEEIHKWKNGNYILSNNKFIIIDTITYSISIQDSKGWNVISNNHINVDVSSTLVRNWINSGVEVYPFVPEPVLKYIKKNELYI